MKNSKEYNREYYRTHKKQAMESIKQWKSRNPDKQKEYRIKNYERAMANGTFRYWKLLAACRRTGLPRTWAKSDFIEWYQGQEKICYYCGCHLTEHGQDYKTELTLDRMDNAKGYEPNNVVLCCHRCNQVKGVWISSELMKEIAQKYLNQGLYTNRPMVNHKES